MLSVEQKQIVAKWFQEGVSLNDIQKRIKEEFDLHIRYFDLRLLVSDMPAPVEAEEEKSEAVEDNAPSSELDRQEIPAPDEEPPPLTPVDGEANENSIPLDVEVSIDKIIIPGAIASGDVTFSDGVKAKWYVDQRGQLGLGGDVPPGYRPPTTDAPVFQSKLMALLQSKGMM